MPGTGQENGGRTLAFARPAVFDRALLRPS